MQTCTDWLSTVCAARQSYPDAHGAAASHATVHSLPDGFFRHSRLLHAAGPNEQSAPSPPPPSGKHTLTSSNVPSAFGNLAF